MSSNEERRNIKWKELELIKKIKNLQEKTVANCMYITNEMNDKLKRISLRAQAALSTGQASESDVIYLKRQIFELNELLNETNESCNINTEDIRSKITSLLNLKLDNIMEINTLIKTIDLTNTKFKNLLIKKMEDP